jgi:hypothetical protein
MSRFSPQPADGPGVIVTASSIWQIRDGRYTRVPRHRKGRQPSPSLDGSLDDNTPVPYRDARFECDDGGVWYLRVIPSGRDETASGIVSGTIEASTYHLPGVEQLPRDVLNQQNDNTAIDQLYYPPSPVPDDSYLQPGELPFTAFGQFGTGGFDLRVFDQNVYWVDYQGQAHLLATMDLDYARNVLTMLQNRSLELHRATIRRTIIQAACEALFGNINGELLAGELGGGDVASVQPDAWLNSTPLVRALKARLDKGR